MADRNPYFLITEDDYSPIGAVVVERNRWIGRSTDGSKMFDRKDFAGMKQAAEKIGLLVSTAWYGIQS